MLSRTATIVKKITNLFAIENFSILLYRVIIVISLISVPRLHPLELHLYPKENCIAIQNGLWTRTRGDL